MKDKISNIITLSNKLYEEALSLRADVKYSDLSQASKECIRENINMITGSLDRVHILLREIERFSVPENLNLAHHERRLIVLALKRHSGNKHGSARELKISGRTMFRKLKEHNIAESEYLDTANHDGRSALSSTYKEDYDKIISYINKKNIFWIKDLKNYMNYGRNNYSPVINILDYLNTKNLIECAKKIKSGKQYKVVRPILPEDLTFVHNGRDKMACFT